MTAFPQDNSGFALIQINRKKTLLNISGTYKNRAREAWAPGRAGRKGSPPASAEGREAASVSLPGEWGSDLKGGSAN